jgi:hypothetical protein
MRSMKFVVLLQSSSMTPEEMLESGCSFASDGIALGMLTRAQAAALDALEPIDSFVNIFNGRNHTAGKRLQCVVDHTSLIKVWCAMQASHPSLKQYEMLKAHIIKSEAGCVAQPWHHDFDCEGGASAIVALQDGTPLWIEFRGARVQVNLRRCQYIVFDGLKPHAGSAFSKDNTRAHFYCGLRGVEAPDDEVYLLVGEPKATSKRT